MAGIHKILTWLKTFLKGKKDRLVSWQCVGNGQWHHLFCQANLLLQCTAFSTLLLCLTLTSSLLKCCWANWFIQCGVSSLSPLCLSVERWWKHHSSGECFAVPSTAFLLISWSLFFQLHFYGKFYYWQEHQDNKAMGYRYCLYVWLPCIL